MANNQLAVRDGGDLDVMTLGGILAKSGFFADTKDAGQAIVKILAGRELGFGPIASMTGIYIVKGKVSLSANLIAAAVKRSGKYDYTVNKLADDECVLMFWTRGRGGAFVEVGESRFTMADAKRAQLADGNWTKFPRNMLFARAMSNGAKWYCPDIFGGPVYTPDELGAVTNEEGEVVDMQPAPPFTPLPNGLHAEARAEADKAFDELDTPQLAPDQAPPTNNQLARIHILAKKLFPTPERVAEYRIWLKESYGVESSKDLSEATAQELIERLVADEKEQARAH